MYHTCEVPMTLSEYDYEDAKDHLIGLREDVYKTGCIEDLDYHLAAILCAFDLHIPETDPLLERKKTKPTKTKHDEVIEQWVLDTVAYSKSLCKQGDQNGKNGRLDDLSTKK